MAKAIKWWNAWLDDPEGGNANAAITIERPTVTATSVPLIPPAPPAPAQPQASGPQRVQCVMIEIDTSYTGGKTQINFACNGLEHPLKYTKPIGDMVKLLAPLGFTPAHIVIGQKYPVSCWVTYHESTKDGKTYKNVDKVEAA